eukprot:jgi/Mesen1/8276/ME000448S07422
MDVLRCDSRVGVEILSLVSGSTTKGYRQLKVSRICASIQPRRSKGDGSRRHKQVAYGRSACQNAGPPCRTTFPIALFDDASLGLCRSCGLPTSRSLGGNNMVYRKLEGRRRRRRMGIMCAVKESPYEILGVSATATEKEIKQAYRKLALKYHPDVNKAADAQQQFVRIKTAYQTLSDFDSRRKFDRAGKSGDSWGEAFDPFSWRGGQTRQKEKEEFYGFEDFFRDIQSDLDKRQKARQNGPPKSLWEELSELGEEFVEFLEKNIPSEEGGTTAKSSSKSSTSSATSRSNSSQQREAPQAPTKSAEEEVEDMLAKLKREMGLK